MTGDSITVTKIRDVLMVTMPPDPDDTTVAELQERVLNAMEMHSPRGLVLDISAVDILDSFFARTVSETVQMVALMGGRTVISGMRPSVAITVTQLGLSFGRALAALDVERALDMLNSLPEWRR